MLCACLTGNFKTHYPSLLVFSRSLTLACCQQPPHGLVISVSHSRSAVHLPGSQGILCCTLCAGCEVPGTPHMLFPTQPFSLLCGFCRNLGLALLRSEAPNPKAAAARLYSSPELSANHFVGTGDGGERRDNQTTVMAKGFSGSHRGRRMIG